MQILETLNQQIKQFIADYPTDWHLHANLNLEEVLTEYLPAELMIYDEIFVELLNQQYQENYQAYELSAMLGDKCVHKDYVVVDKDVDIHSIKQQWLEDLISVKAIAKELEPIQ